MSEQPTESGADPVAGFAAMLGQAKDLVEKTETSEAPYGYTTDPDGSTRPKKAAGRPRKSPSLEELKAAKAEKAPDEGATNVADRAPDERATRRSRGKGATNVAPKEEPKYPQFREGQIEKGINRLYRKTGKLVRVWDVNVGQALIDITIAEDPDDTTVGKAWEEIARVNPRIRKFLLRIISGGAWGGLVMAHAPVFLALFMKYKLGEKLPMGQFLGAFLDSDEDGAPADGSPLEGLTPEDMSQMGGLINSFMPMVNSMSPEDLQQAAQMASQMFGGPKVSPAANARTEPETGRVPTAGDLHASFARKQPKRTTRAQRSH